jgi:DNA-binding CsgD family transcriptional regulator
MKRTGRPERGKEGYHWFRGWQKPSAAQRRVLDELVAGGTNAQIASRLGISEDGVKWHLSELREEIGLSDRRELAEWWTAERQRPGTNLLLPLAGVWRLIARNAVAFVAMSAIVAVLVAVGWLAFGSLHGSGDRPAAVAPVPTHQPAPIVPLVPTPTPTLTPRGALVFDVTTGASRIVPGDYCCRRWLNGDDLTFLVYSTGGPATIDADGKVEPLSDRTNVGFQTSADGKGVVIWGYEDGKLSVVDADTGEETQLADFGSDPLGNRREDVSAGARKVAISNQPYDSVTVYDLDGSHSHLLFSAPPEEGVKYFQWSPAGRWLLIVTARRNEDGVIRGAERSLVFDAGGTLVLQRDSTAHWVGAQSLLLSPQSDATAPAGSAGTDLLDVAHDSPIPFSGGTLICISPDSRYAVATDANAPGFNTPTEFQLRDLATGEVISSVVEYEFLVNCDWTPDGTKVVLSPGGK